MTLGELRRGLLVTQSDIGNRLGLTTAAVADLEERPVLGLDVNQLSLYLLALGGRLYAVVPAPSGAERTVRL